MLTLTSTVAGVQPAYYSVGLSSRSFNGFVGHPVRAVAVFAVGGVVRLADGVRCRAGLCDTIRTAPPVGDLGLVDLVAPVVDRRETRGGADRAVDVDHTTAGSTNQVVV